VSLSCWLSEVSPARASELITLVPGALVLLPVRVGDRTAAVEVFSVDAEAPVYLVSNSRRNERRLTKPKWTSAFVAAGVQSCIEAWIAEVE